jgi:membrane-associated protease RseP (regulator of RpoE activity)
MSQNSNYTITFNALGVVIFLAIIVYCATSPAYLSFLLCLSINVLLHELGHYIAGRFFKCKMNEVSLFFVPAVTYESNESRNIYNTANASWRNTKWTLGALPFGGYTSFMTTTAPLFGDWRTSPFVNHKPAFARLIINGAGILVNFFTFLILFIAFPPGGSILIDEIMNIALVLSIINLLPFYPLDGSSILITIYEIVTGHKPSSGFMNVFKIAGAALMIYLFWINPSILNRLLAMILP